MAVRLIAVSRPVIDDVPGTAELLAFCARVSATANQLKHETGGKLLRSLVKRREWSPLEMVSLTIEIETTRDIARQILRHRSFSFQEFSQRYATVVEPPVFREARLQDSHDRQNSIGTDDQVLKATWHGVQSDLAAHAQQVYQWALDQGIAKEVARAVLPEGMTPIAKARSVASYVRMLLREAPRVLLTGWHRDVYEIWADALADFNPVLYTGSETPAAKARSVEAFTQGDARVMMISLRSGVGLDGLQFNCRDVVFGELDWSPQVHYQIIGRLRRPGQPEQVTAHYLHTDWGSDPVVIEMLGLKSDQSRGINDPGVAPAAKFSDDSRLKRLAAHVLGEAVPA